MSHVAPSVFARGSRLAPLALVALSLSAWVAPAAWAADMPFAGDEQRVAPFSAGGGGYWAPLVPVRPAPLRFDIYGYPLLGPGLLGRPAPQALGVGCPPALQPAYDPDGNLAGYAPLQYCR